MILKQCNKKGEIAQIEEILLYYSLYLQYSLLMQCHSHTSSFLHTIFPLRYSNPFFHTTNLQQMTLETRIDMEKNHKRKS